MKLTEEQIWKCNQTEDGVHICVAHQNVVDFARSIEREIGFSKAELWIKRINDAVLAEREACAALCFQMWEKWVDADPSERDNLPRDAEDCAAAIRARGSKTVMIPAGHHAN